MTENQRLRKLLSEARDCLLGAQGVWRERNEDTYADSASELTDRIDAALAEPVADCSRCEKLRELADIAAAEQGLAQRRMMEAQRERDKARGAATDAYQRGAKAMREAAARAFDGEALNGVLGPYFGNIIRVLPIPEDKS